MNYLADVNLRIALVADQHVHHPAASRCFRNLGDDKLAFCRVTQMGFLRLLTNKHVMQEEVVSPDQAWIFNHLPKPGGNSLLAICRDNLEPARQAARGGSLRGDQPRYPDRDLVEDMAVEDRRSYLPSLPSVATISFPKV